MRAPASAATRSWRPAARPRAGNVLLPALLLLFLASGVSGLIYEVVWLRFLTLVFGVTIYAVSTVLTVFMGGLALGGYLAGRIADRLRRPLRVYGLVEVGIGLSALLTPPAFGLLNSVYRALYPALPQDLTSLSLVRFVLACLILLVPTTLMGATLPIVVRSSLGRSGSLGTNLSLLYASNTAGGIAGAYLAGFVLIGGAGVRATTMVAAALNIGVGIIAILLDWWQRETSEVATNDVARSKDPATSIINAGTVSAQRVALRWLLIAFLVSGFVSLAYQVIWTRILAMFFESSTYAFNLILCTFLLGLAVGSYLVAPVINRRANWLFVAAVMEWAIALTALLSVFAISHLHQLVDVLRRLPLAEHLVSGEQRATAVMAFVTMFPTTVLLGAAFPIIMKLYAGRGESAEQGTGGRAGAQAESVAGRRLGRAYAANVCGAIAGSWAAGFVLIPLLGTHASLVSLAAVNALVALGLLRYAAPEWFRSLAPAGLALAVGAAALTPDMYSAVFARYGDRVEWYEEGLEQTVTVLQGPEVRRMYLNGRHQANDSPGMVRLHDLIGHLPMLLQPASGGRAASGSVSGGTLPAGAPRRVLVVGLGGGATAGAAAVYDGAMLDVVELSDSVVRGARFFSHVNGNVHDAPNVRLRTDDGRNHLLLTTDKYDVIMADAVRPQHAGSAALYSGEYFQLARSALADGGVMIQWLDDSIPESQYKLLLRTFLSVFAYATAWVDGAFIIGSERPYGIDRQLIAERLSGRAKGAAERIDLTSPESVIRLFTATDAELRAYAGEGLVVSDDHPYVEFFRSLPHDRKLPDTSVFRRDPSALLR